MNSMFRCLVALCAALLAACAGPVVAPVAPAFDLTGRVAVRFQDRGFSSAVHWKQNGGSDEIWLTAPLGQPIAHLQADAAGAILTAADQKQYRASSIESLTRSALGWRFPVAGMRYWVFGQPAPGMTLTAIERNDAGRIMRFRQDDWQVAFNYAATGLAPSRLEIVSSDANIRFVIDRWTPGPP